ncbi:MAG: hypothetical protein WAU32_03400 [Thermoanaerobaculia bacterium]
MIAPDIRTIQRWSYTRQALALALCVAFACYLPVLWGRVPLPTDLLPYFPPWEHVPPPPPSARHHAELGDLLTLMYPWRAYLHQSFASGQIPYWNPYTYLGSPFLANPISAVFYPPNLLYAFLPLNAAWSLQFPLRIGLAVFFMALLARRLGASRLGGLLAGAVFGLSGFLTGWQGWPQSDCLVWAPLILLCLVELRRRPGPRQAAFAGLAAAMPMLAGHPEVCLYVLATAAAFWVFQVIQAVRRGRRGRWVARYVGASLLAAALAAAMCAVQLFPTAEWLPRITRRLDRPWGPFPSRDQVALISRDAQATPNSIGIAVPEQCCYAGIGTLLLLPLAFRRKRDVAVFFGLAGLAALSVAFGLPPVSGWFRALPWIRALPGTRLLGILDLSLAALAGLGFSNLQRRRRLGEARLPPGQLAPVAVMASVVGVLVVLAKRRASGGLWQGGAGWGVSAGLLAVCLLLLFVAARSRSWSRTASGALAGVVALDLLTFGKGHVPLVSAQSVFPPSPVVEFLRQNTALGERVLFLSSTAPANAEMIYGIHTPGGYPQVLRETARLLAPLNGGSEEDEPLPPFTAAKVAAADPRLVDSLGVRFLVTNVYKESEEARSKLAERYPLRYLTASVRVHENSRAFPLAYVAGDAKRREPAGRVSELQEGLDSVSGDVSCDAPCLLVVNVTAFPGWRAFVDGAPRPILFDSPFLSFRVPAGSHQFRLIYRPPRLHLAATITGLGLALTLACIWFGRSRRPRTGAGRVRARPSRSRRP